MAVKNLLNPTRAKLLRKLFLREDTLKAKLAAVTKAREALGRDYWNECGYLIRPNVNQALRREVFKEEAGR